MSCAAVRVEGLTKINLDLSQVTMGVALAAHALTTAQDVKVLRDDVGGVALDGVVVGVLAVL